MIFYLLMCFRVFSSLPQLRRVVFSGRAEAVLILAYRSIHWGRREPAYCRDHHSSAEGHIRYAYDSKRNEK
jgi:hypothetical protein